MTVERKSMVDELAEITLILRQTPAHYTRDDLIAQSGVVVRKLSDLRRRMVEAKAGEWYYSPHATTFGQACALCSRSVRQPALLCETCTERLMALKTRLALVGGLIPDLHADDV